MKTLRFALLLDQPELPAWAADCTRRVLDSGHADLVLVIRQPRAAAAGLRRPELLYRLYSAHWLGRRSSALKRRAFDADVARVSQLSLSRAPGKNTLNADDLREIEAHELDFILCFGSRPLDGALLDLPRLGVWSHRHDRLAAPGFWEIVQRRPTTEASLERLSSPSRPGQSLHQGWFGTCGASWVNNIDRVFSGSADFCARACAEIANRDGDEATPTDTTARDLPTRSPTNREMLQFLARAAAHAVHKLWELSFHVEVWNVGFIRESVAEVLHGAMPNAEGVRWCKPHAPGHFIADPFAYGAPGAESLLVEEYDQGGKGRICRVVGADGPGPLELEVDFDEAYHLSYPCIYSEDGTTYCVPEAYQSSRASLYKRVGGTWQLERTLLEGAPIVDPTLFKHGGLYWILCTHQNDGAYGNLKLYAYYAERLDGVWKPHLLNPVKCDVSSTRPAGSPVSVDGELYRPSQDCSVTYGGAVVINRIARLSPTEFEEVQALRVEPLAQGPYPDGLHTLNAMGSGSVIDSKKFCFDAFGWQKNRGRFHEVFR